MNSTNLKISFQELSEYFTPDAWQLIDSFVLSLQKKMDQFNISSEEQVTVFEWIEEFIQEFVEDYKGRAKINFDEALGLIREIGSPSEILQAMELPVEQVTKEETAVPTPETVVRPAQAATAPQTVIVPQKVLTRDERGHKLPCSACNWPNYPDAVFCENCGRRITEPVETKQTPTLLPGMSTHPTAFSILYSYILLLIIGLFEGVILYISNLDDPNESDALLTDIVPAVIGVMMIPAVVFGLAMGYLVERLQQDQQPVDLPSEIIKYPNATSILLTYCAFLIIAFVEGVLVYLINATNPGYQHNNWLMAEWMPGAAVIVIAPSIIFGLIFSYLIQQVDQARSATETPRRMEAAKDSYFPQEIIDYPFIATFLLAYLVLVIFGNFTYVLEGWGNFDLESFYDMPTEALVPAIVIGIVAGLLISRLSPVSSKSKYRRQLTYFQKYHSLGVILTAISIWLFFIYAPIKIGENEYTIISIFLTIGSFVLPGWLYKWNLENRPSDAPYWDLVRHKKVIESYNSKKLKDLNIVGGVIILIFVVSAWSTRMTWTLFGLPAWVTVAFSLLLFLNGAGLMSYYSWARINRFISMVQS